MIYPGESYLCKPSRRFRMACWLMEVMSLLAWISLSYLSAQNKLSCPFSSGSTSRPSRSLPSLQSRLLSMILSLHSVCVLFILALLYGLRRVALPLYENMTPSCQGSVAINRRHGGGATPLEILIFRLHFGQRPRGPGVTLHFLCRPPSTSWSNG